MAEFRLTWHAGSVLPFASLWHTLRRLSSLNSLRTADLPDADPQCVPGVRSAFQPGTNLLYNEAAGWKEAVSIRALATWLGEPPEIFQWSNLGRVPHNLRFLIHDEFRICPTCIAKGYHSALLSLKLLEACPIHGSSLVSRCWCGRRFDCSFGPKALACAGHCECGRIGFFTGETCRRPTLRLDETRPLLEVAGWFERLAHLGLPGREKDGHQGSAATSWLAGLMNWCDVLGLGYPSCFVEPPAQRARSGASVHRCGMTPEKMLRHPARATYSHPREGCYWYADPATLAYRGMARHLRRHVARGTEQIAMSFLEEPDPIRLAEAMRSNKKAMVAFAEMVWAQAMEYHVLRRRWPYRPINHGSGGWFVGRIEPPLIDPDFAIDPIRRLWIDYHAGETLMLASWRAAQRCAVHAMRSGVADWRLGRDPETTSWVASRVQGGLQLAALRSHSSYDWTLPLPDKNRRRAAAADADAHRMRDIRAACKGPCLNWSPGGEWVVKASASPQGTTVARHRLLGVQGSRPTFWLFEGDDGQFVARACDIKLQVTAPSPRAAIEALRRAMQQYRQRYGAPHLEPPTPVVSPQIVRDDLYERYLSGIHCAAHDYGFWRGAGVLHDTAARFLASRESGQAS